MAAKITVKWNAWPASANVDNIELEYSADGSTGWTPVPAGSYPLAPGTTSYEDTDVVQNEVKYYRLRASHAIAGPGPWSAPLMATAANEDPPPPTGLTVGTVTSSSIQLSWTGPSWPDPGPPGARYQVYLNGVAHDLVPDEDTEYTFTGLLENTEYLLGVRSIDALGLSSTVATIGPNASTRTPNAPPADAPSSPIITKETNLPTMYAAWSPPAEMPDDFSHYEVQALRHSDDVVLASAITTGLTREFPNLAWGIDVKFRVRTVDSQDAASAWAVSAATAMMADPVPTGLSVSVDKTDMTFSWTPPAVLPADFVNYRVIAYDAAGTYLAEYVRDTTSFTFDDLPYSTSRRFRVQTTRTGALAPSQSAMTSTQTTIADPKPASVSRSTSGTSITVTWAAPSGGEPDDSTVYRVRLKSSGGSVLQQATVAYNATHSRQFTGLSYSTTYGMDVRLERSNGQHSSYTSGSNITTAAPPDSTPPASITVDLRPEVSYGRMVARFTLAPDCATYRVLRQINDGAWENLTGDLPYAAGERAHLIGTYPAGTKVNAMVYQWDAAGNWRFNGAFPYTLEATPRFVKADSTNTYRQQSGVHQYNPAGTYRMFVGYYSDPSLNATGFLYYNENIWWAIATDYGRRKTVTGMDLHLARHGGGNGIAEDITVYLHVAKTSPGTVNGVARHNMSGTAQWWGTLAPWTSATRSLSSALVNALASASPSYRGIAIYHPSGKPYMIMHAKGEYDLQGRLSIHHLG